MSLSRHTPSRYNPCEHTFLSNLTVLLLRCNIMPVFEPYFQHHEDQAIGADVPVVSLSPSSSSPAGGQPQLYRVRERQWMYLGPIAAAPLAHIGVTLYRSAVTPFQKKCVVGGVVATTILAVGMRLVLMVHAGYPGGPNSAMVQRERIVTMEEKTRMEQATTLDIVKAAAKGFG